MVGLIRYSKSQQANQSSTATPVSEIGCNYVQRDCPVTHLLSSIAIVDVLVDFPILPFQRLMPPILPVFPQ